MRSLTLVLTSKCNLNCSYCFCGTKHNSTMTLEYAKKAIDILQRDYPHEPKVLSFMGGEPLVEYNLMKKIIEYTKTLHSNFIFSCTTNGTLLTREIIEYFAEIGMGLQLSIDGFGEDANSNRLFKSDQNIWDSFYINCLLLKDLDLIGQASLRMTLTPENCPSIVSGIEKFIDLGFKTINIQPNDSIIWQEKDIKEYQLYIEELANLYYSCLTSDIDVVLNPIDRYIKSAVVGQISCNAITNGLTVSYDGCIYPCHRIDFTNPVNTLGNIEEGVNKDLRRALEEDWSKKDPECTTCALQKRCIVCPEQNRRLNGSYSSIPEHVCEMNKLGVFTADKIAYQLYTDNNKIFKERYFS